MYGGATKVVDPGTFEVTEESLAIQNISVLAPDGQRFLPNRTVLIEDGLITQVDSNLAINDTYTIIDGSGKYLIPGLTDAHVHLWRSQNDLLLYVANGVTQIRELVGEKFHLKWREEIEAGRLGPDMFITSPRLGTFGLVPGWFMSWSQRFDNIRSPAAAEKAVSRYQEMGYDGIKIYSQLRFVVYLLCRHFHTLPMRTKMSKRILDSASTLLLPGVSHDHLSGLLPDGARPGFCSRPALYPGRSG